MCTMAVHGQQKVTVSGRVIGSKGEAIASATVAIGRLNIKTSCDENGNYRMDNIPPGTHRITVSAVGYTTWTEAMDVTRDMTSNFKLEEETQSLQAVTVTGKSEAQQVRETGYNVNVIETQQFENRTMNLNQILNQTTGIRIRETGGVGSDYEFMLNGLSGSRVRFFLNGEPLENAGSLFNLNNIPVNLIERIDVYKGAVPIHLGGDALGGAVDIITKQKSWNYLDASYSFGSFNTHLVNLSGQYKDNKTGLTVKPQFFYNYSNNDYKMRNLTIGTVSDGNATQGDFRRFHDVYRSYYGNVEIGLTDKKWADYLMVGAALGDYYNEAQHGARGTKNDDGSFSLLAIGEAYNKEDNRRFSLSYAKRNLLDNRLNVNLNASYGHMNYLWVDTSSNSYDWTGKIIATNRRGGETSDDTKFFTDLIYNTFALNSGVTYAINKHHQLAASFVWTYEDWAGRNRLSDDIDTALYQEPNSLQKKIIGLSYQNSAFNDKLKTTVAAKYYIFGIFTKAVKEYSFEEFTVEDKRTSTNDFGASIATRYMASGWIAKASYEFAYRLPESYEIFGDGGLTLANPDILPESSNNLNLGAQYGFDLAGGKLDVSADGFYRVVDNMIYMVAGAARFNQYTNMQSVLIRGVEGELRYRYKNNLNIVLNVTYQDVLNNQKYVEGTKNVENFVYRDRMYNTPWLFGNLNAEYMLRDISHPKFRLGLVYSMNYVHEFYLGYSRVARGGAKYTIPWQLNQNAGITVSTKNNRYNVTIECNNLANTKTYDNFGLQKPGRVFYTKLRYFLQQH